jgi:hypothetical protein
MLLQDRASVHVSDTMAGQVVIGMDPHKRSVTIEVMASHHPTTALPTAP